MLQIPKNIEREKLASRDKFFEIADNMKLSPAQKKILEILRSGDRIKIINAHRMNGGEWTWERAGYAGRVYRAFWNLMHNVLYMNGYAANVANLDFMI